MNSGQESGPGPCREANRGEARTTGANTSVSDANVRRANDADDEEHQISDAVEQVATASRNVFEERLDLLRIETLLAARHSLRAGGLLGAGVVLCLGAWLFASVGAAFAFGRSLSPEASLGAIAAIDLAIGLVLLWRGARRLARPGEGELP